MTATIQAVPTTGAEEELLVPILAFELCDKAAKEKCSAVTAVTTLSWGGHFSSRRWDVLCTASPAGCQPLWWQWV